MPAGCYWRFGYLPGVFRMLGAWIGPGVLPAMGAGVAGAGVAALQAWVACWGVTAGRENVDPGAAGVC